MTSPSQPRWPNPGPDGRLKEKHLPAHLGQTNLNATYGRAGLVPAPPVFPRYWPKIAIASPFGPTSHGWAHVGAGTAVASDTSDAAIGTRCISVTTAGDGSVSNMKNTTQSLDTTGKGLVFWIKVTGAQNIAGFDIWVANAANLANSWKMTLNLPSGGKSPLREGEWVPVIIPWANLAVAYGAPTRTGVTTLQLDVKDAGGGNQVTFKLGGFGTYSEGDSRYPNGVVSLDFDDSHAEAWTIAKSALGKYGYRATLYPIVERLGTANYLTVDQLRALRDSYGWDVGGHCMLNSQHSSRVGLSESDVRAMLTQLREWQRQNGLESAAYAYPAGNFDKALQNIVGQYYSFARTNDGKHAQLPSAARMNVSALSVGNNRTLASAQAFVDAAYAEKSWITFVFHNLDTSGSANAWTPTDFTALIDYIASKGIAVATASDVMSGR